MNWRIASLSDDSAQHEVQYFFVYGVPIICIPTVDNWRSQS